MAEGYVVPKSTGRFPHSRHNSQPRESLTPYGPKIAKAEPTLQQLIAAAKGRTGFIARKTHPPFTIIVYDDPRWAEERAAQLGAEVHHALMRQPNVSATISVITADISSVPFEPISIAEFEACRATSN